MYPFSEYRSPKKDLDWLKEKDPVFYSLIEYKKIHDFNKVKNYSGSSEKIYSENGWACIGNAAVFSDPFYSPGGIMIAFGNSIVTKMIEIDFKKELSPKTVNSYNDFIISKNNNYTYSIQAN